MQGLGKKRWFKLGFMGWLSMTVMPFALMAGIGTTHVYVIGYVFFSGVEESGIKLDEKLVIEIYKENDQYFGRKGKKVQVANPQKIIPSTQINPQKVKATQGAGLKKAQYI